jgi:transposase
MEIFLAEVAKRHPKEFIFMIYDGASCHNQGSLKMPENMATEKLPPYSPELNPTEAIWDDMREKFFPNFVFDSMDAVEEKLIEAMLHFENNPKTVQSISGYKWIVKAKLK